MILSLFTPLGHSIFKSKFEISTRLQSAISSKTLFCRKDLLPRYQTLIFPLLNNHLLLQGVAMILYYIISFLSFLNKLGKEGEGRSILTLPKLRPLLYSLARSGFSSFQSYLTPLSLLLELGQKSSRICHISYDRTF